MESDSLGLYMALLHIDFITCQDDRNVLADADKVTSSTLEFCAYFFQTDVDCVLTVPIRDVLVGDTGSDIEHDDSALAIDVITIS